MSLCCAECFADPQLKQWVEAEGEAAAGTTCNYCGSSGRLLSIGHLTPIFRQLIDHFFIRTTERVDSAHFDHAAVGDSLDRLFDDDFEVFSPKLLELGQRKALLFGILDEGCDPRDGEHYNDGSLWCMSDSQPYVWSISDYWGTLKQSIMRLGHGLLIGKKFNGTDTEEGAYQVILQEIEQLPAILSPADLLWRARPGAGHTGPTLCAPPPHRAPAARANLKGQPVLYLTSDRETALHEVRPAKGDTISVGRFRVNKPVKICDLVPHFEAGSPFGNFEKFVEAHRRNELRGALGLALAQAVLPGTEDKEYLPTQFLCQMIRATGYDGVAFASAQRPRVPSGIGAPKRDEFFINYVLFDPKGASQEGVAEEFGVNGPGDFYPIVR